MNKLVSLLRSPYPVLFQRWKSVVIPSAIVAFILYAFQPFGISLKEGSKLGIAIGSGGITAGASVICHYLLPALFPSYYKEQHWTLGKYVLDLLLLFFLIAVGLWLYISWLSGIGMNGSLFLLVCTWVMILAPFPLVFCLIWNRNMVLARNLKEAAEINSFLSRKMSAEGGGNSPEKKEGDTGRLVFSGGTKDVLEVSDCDFLYAEAEGNYVRVVFAAAGDYHLVPPVGRGGQHVHGGGALVQRVLRGVLGPQLYPAQRPAQRRRCQVYDARQYRQHVGVPRNFKLFLCAADAHGVDRRMVWHVCGLDLPEYFVWGTVL